LSILKRFASDWDLALPLLGLVLLFLEVSPRPVFDLGLESFRILSQFPLVGFAFLAAKERRFVPAVVAGCLLAAAQGAPSVVALVHGRMDLETAFPCLAWCALLGSYFHPARRGVYFAERDSKESR